jgi:hypothetical protein
LPEDLQTLSELKRKDAKTRLAQIHRETKITEETYTELLGLNEEIASEITNAIETIETIRTHKILETPIDVLKPYPRPKSEQDLFIEMRRLIEGDQGSHNALVRAQAADIARRASLERFPIEVPPTYLTFNRKMGLEWIRFVQHCRVVAQSIYDFVSAQTYMSEAGEYLQSPLHTMKVVRGGDCDDLAMEMAALWRSLGFQTYVKFMPGHVFAGVILPQLVLREARETERKDSTNVELADTIVFMPGDVQTYTIMKRRFSQFDLLLDRPKRVGSEIVILSTFYDILGEIVRECHSNPEKMKALKADLNSVRQAFEYVSGSGGRHEIPQLDQSVEQVELADLFWMAAKAHGFTEEQLLKNDALQRWPGK